MEPIAPIPCAEQEVNGFSATEFVPAKDGRGWYCPACSRLFPRFMDFDSHLIAVHYKAAAVGEGEEKAVTEEVLVAAKPIEPLEIAVSTIYPSCLPS